MGGEINSSVLDKSLIPDGCTSRHWNIRVWSSGEWSGLKIQIKLDFNSIELIFGAHDCMRSPRESVAKRA